MKLSHREALDFFFTQGFSASFDRDELHRGCTQQEGHAVWLLLNRLAAYFSAKAGFSFTPNGWLASSWKWESGDAYPLHLTALGETRFAAVVNLFRKYQLQNLEEE